MSAIAFEAGQLVGAIRRIHREGLPLSRRSLEPTCTGCNAAWPCDSLRLADFTEKMLSMSHAVVHCEPDASVEAPELVKVVRGA